MQTVTVTFKTASNKDATATFDVYAVAELDKKQARELNTLPNSFYLGREQWAETEDWVSLKLAATAAGLENQRCILIEK